jgi:maltose alpha-D-glucosyltransferase/alpha-amylase
MGTTGFVSGNPKIRGHNMASRAPLFSAPGTLEAIANWVALADLVAAFDPEYLRQQRWFGSKSKPITRLQLNDYAVLRLELPLFILALIEVEYAGSDAEIYSVPLMISDRAFPQLDPLLELKTASGGGFVYEALADDEFCRALLHKIAYPTELSAMAGRFKFEKTTAFIQPESPTVKRSQAEQSNTSIIFGNVLILKNFRKVEPGINPDLEISRFLTTKTDFSHIPPLAGTIEYFGSSSGAAISMLQRFVPNHGDTWEYTLRHLEEFYAAAARSPKKAPSRPDTSVGSGGGSCRTGPTPAMEETVGELMRDYAAEALQLGHITGQLHVALASAPHDADFAPEPIVGKDVERWITLIKQHIDTGLQALDRLSSYGPELERTASELIRKKPDYLAKVEELRGLEASQTHKIRCHGDYHLGQVLKTGDGFCILDFEGEPLRSLQERREKTSPLKDVAGMLRSYHYAAYAGLFAFAEHYGHERDTLEPWARAWERQAGQTFLDGYVAEARRTHAAIVPSSMDLLTRVLSVFLLDKAVYELNYELNHRPSWLRIPLEGIQVAMELG